MALVGHLSATSDQQHLQFSHQTLELTTVDKQRKSYSGWRSRVASIVLVK